MKAANEKYYVFLCVLKVEIDTHHHSIKMNNCLPSFLLSSIEAKRVLISKH